MKKKRSLKTKVAAAAVILFCIVGMTFCVLRPSYVQEAWNILFQVQMEPREPGRQNDDPGQADTDPQEQPDNNNPGQANDSASGQPKEESH